VALLATLAIGSVYLPASQLEPVRQLESQLLDLRLRLRRPGPPSDAIVLLHIDDRSLAEIGRWPWSRAVIAELIRRTQEAGARTIALDLLLTEPEPGAVPASELERLRQLLEAAPAADPAARIERAGRALAELLADAGSDARLARRLEDAGRVVLPILFELAPGPADADAEPPPYLARTAFRVVEQAAADALAAPQAGGRPLLPIARLGAAAATLGHANVPLDQDGAARRELPVIAWREAYYPSFALEVARLHLGVGRDRVRLLLGRGIQLGERFLPTDESMRMPVNYRGAGRFPAVSAAALMSGAFDPQLLADRIVLIGGTAAGVGESFATPFSRLLPGIARHATVVDSILRQDFLKRREASALIDLAAVILSGVLIGGLAARRGLLAASLAFAALLAALTAINLYAFLGLGWWLNLFLPLAALSGIYLPVAAYGYFVEQRQERRVRAAFKHYLSPTLVDQVARDPALLQRGGEQKELTVLFADIRQSTELAAALGPSRFALLLNEVLSVLSGVLLEHGGMLDKFVGDGLVAVFGAPLPQPDHAEQACRAALAMQQGVMPLRARWAEPGLPPLEVGVGIHTGSMIIGNMGSAERFNYTVVGEEAHLGARLEAANKDFRTRILISEATWQKVADRLAARELDLVRFRGIERAVRVFELLGEQPLPEPQAEHVQRFASALAHYRGGRFAAAGELFEQLLVAVPDDRPSALYVERCRKRLAAGAGGGGASEDAAAHGRHQNPSSANPPSVASSSTVSSRPGGAAGAPE
jgi:adenylate cyclase